MSHIQSQQIENKFKAKYPIMLFPLRIESRFMRIGSESTGPGTPADLELEAILNGLQNLEDPIITSSSGGIKKSLQLMSSQYDRFYNTLKTNTSKAALPMRSDCEQWKLAAISGRFKSLSNVFMAQYSKGVDQMKAQSQQVETALENLQKSSDLKIGKVANLSDAFFIPIEKMVDEIAKLLKYPPTAPELSSDIIMERLTAFHNHVEAIRSHTLGLTYISPSDKDRLVSLIKKVSEKGYNWNKEAQKRINQDNDYTKKLYGQFNTVVNQHQEIMVNFGPSKTDQPFITSWTLLETIRQNIFLIERRKEQFDLTDIHKLITENNDLIDQLVKELSSKEKQSAYTYTDILALTQWANQIQDRLANETDRLSTGIFQKKKVNEEFSSFLMKSTNIPVGKGTPPMEQEALNSLLQLHQQIKSIFELRSQQSSRFGIKEFVNAQPKLTMLFEQFAQQLFDRSTFNYADANRFKELVSEIIDLYAIWNLDISRLADQLKYEAEGIKKANSLQLPKLAVLNKILYGKAFNPRAQAWGQQHALDKLIDHAMTAEGLMNLRDTNNMVNQMGVHIKSLSGSLPQMDYFPEALKFNLKSSIGKLYAWTKNILGSQKDLLNKIMSEIEHTEKAIALLDGVKRLPLQKSEAISLEKEFMMLNFFSFRTELDLSTNHEHQAGSLYKSLLQLKNRIFAATDLFNGLKGIPYSNQKAFIGNIDNFISLSKKQHEQLLEQYKQLSFLPWSKSIYANLSTLGNLMNSFLKEDPNASYLSIWRANAELEAFNTLIANKSAIDLPLKYDYEVLMDRTIGYTKRLSALKILPAGIKGILNKTQQKIQKTLSDSLYQEQIKANPIRYALSQLEQQFIKIAAVKDVKVDGRRKAISEESKITLQTAAKTSTQLFVRNADLMSTEEQMVSSLDIINAIGKVVDQTTSLEGLNKSDYEAFTQETSILLKMYPEWKKQRETALNIVEEQVAALTSYSTRINAELDDSSNTIAGLIGRNTKLSLSPRDPIGRGPSGPKGPTGPGGPGDPGDPGDPSDPVDSEEHELWIRAYPDDIAIDAHEPGLTQEEIEAGIAYWTEVWYALDVRNKELGAWRALVNSYGPERAAWIVKALTPTNLHQKPKPYVYEQALSSSSSVTGRTRLSPTLSAPVKSSPLPKFTQKDFAAGSNFWSSLLNTSGDPIKQTALWKEFSTQYPNGKANLLVQATKPQKLYKALVEMTIAKSIEPKISATKLSSIAVSTVEPLPIKSASDNMNLLVAAPQTPLPTQFIPPVFPINELRPQSWNSPAKTRILPDQLVFILYKGNQKVAEVLGNTIPPELTVGINPADDQTFDPTSNGDLKVGPEINWMFDFDEAISKGMAVKIPVTDIDADPNDPNSGFTRVLVVGIKHSADTDQSKGLVENLFDSHHYVDEGMSFIAPGTPTNNNGDSKSAFNVFDDDDEKSFETEVNGNLFNNTINSLLRTDGQLLAEALGIDSSVFKNIHGSDHQSIRNVELVNTSLWAGTLGFYLEEMYDFTGQFTDHPLNLPEDLDAIRAHFIQFVKSRGSLPSLRVGSQPYGILPVSAMYHDSWKSLDDSNPINQLLIDLLIKKMWGGKNPSIQNGTSPAGSNKWDTIVQENLRSVDDPLDIDANASDLERLVAAQERFMNLLGLTATSSSFYNRYILGSDSGYQGLFTDVGNNFGQWMNFAHTFPEEFGNFIDFGFYDNTYGTPPPNTTYRTADGLMIGRLRAVNHHAQLLGPTVDQYKASPDRKLVKDNQNQNYIQWLLDQDLQSLHETTIQGEDPSKSILYLMLRQALLSQYWDAAMKIYASIDLRDFRYSDILAKMKEDTGLDWEQMTIAEFEALGGNYNDQITLIIGMISFRLVEFFEETDKSHKVGEYINDDPEFQSTDLHRHSYKWFKVGTKDIGDGLPLDRLPEDNELVVASNRWPFLFFRFNGNELNGIPANQTLSMAEYLTQGLAAQHFPQETANLQDFISNMNLLAQLPTQELELLMSEHIDTCSHRMDTWLLSLVNKRLAQLRDGNTNNKGLHIGAFGWVIDLKPGQTRTTTSGSPIVYNTDDNGDSIPLANDPDNQGFIHAPSLNHAVTAAVLKAGYNATGRNELLEVNLSSARVRQAMFYIEGIRNGQNLGALLGYQLERGLHDNNSEELDQYILDLRKAFPLVADTLLNSNSTEAIETIQANQVIDGLKLLEKMREVPYPFGISTLPSASSAQGQAIKAEVLRIEGDLDAVGDLSLAEGVFQVTQGNYSRSNAMMKAVSEGSFIPQPEIIDTPRTGQNLTHRSLVSMTPVTDESSPQFWSSSLTPMAQADPTLNKWIGTLLGNPDNIQCVVHIRKSNTPDVLIEKSINVTQLGIQPLDLIYLMIAEFQGSETALHKLIAGQATAFMPLAEGETFFSVECQFEERYSAWDKAGIKTFVEIFPLVENIYRMISDGRYLRADDLVHPSFDTEGLDNSFGIDFAELQTRVQKIKTNIDGVLSILNGRVTALENTLNLSNLVRVAAWLNKCAQYGIREATVGVYPTNEVSAERADAIIAHADQIRGIINNRQTAFDLEMAKLNNPTLTEVEKMDIFIAAAQALLGKEFKLLPLFSLLNGSEIQNAYTNQSNIIPDEPLVMERWLSGVSRVRDKMWAMENVMLSTTMMDFKNSIVAQDDYLQEDPELSALQLPYRPNDHWVGLEIPEGYFASHNEDTVEVSRDKLSLVSWLNPGFNTQTVFSGILVDEWNELIPNREETTGVAFHYDQPNARPPQTVLLGIHPETSDDSPWLWKHLVNTLHCTLDLAKVRAVEPDHLIVKEHDPAFSKFDAFSHLLTGIVARVGANDPEVDHSFSVDFNVNIDQPLFEYHTPDGGGEPGPQTTDSSF